MEDAPSRILMAILDYNFFPALVTALVNCCNILSFPFICYEDAVLPCAVLVCQLQSRELLAIAWDPVAASVEQAKESALAVKVMGDLPHGSFTLFETA